MENQEPNENHKRIKQPVSVPFLWEEKPGIPKKDWIPNFHQIYPDRPPPLPPLPPPPPPVKFIAAIPFKWEEKPGTPLPCFSNQQPPLEPPLITPSMITSSFRSYELYSQEIDKLWEGDNDGDDEMYDSDGYETSDTFTSAPSVLRGSSVAPLVTVVASHSPASEAGSSTSSYATGTTSLVGVQFLKSLFPLLPPNSSIVWKEPARTPPKGKSHDYDDRESNCSYGFKKPSTLKELIMMSRRKSIHRRAVQENNFSTEFVKTSAIGCCNFGTSNGIQALKANWKKQLQLKLI